MVASKLSAEKPPEAGPPPVPLSVAAGPVGDQWSSLMKGLLSQCGAGRVGRAGGTARRGTVCRVTACRVTASNGLFGRRALDEARQREAGQHRDHESRGGAPLRGVLQSREQPPDVLPAD